MRPFRWIILLLFLIEGHRGYHLTLFKLYGQQMDRYNEVKPEAVDACFIRYNNYDLSVVCPTDVNCYLHTHFRHNHRVSVNDKVSLSSPCKTKRNKRLPVSKTLQLKAVLRILSLVNQTVCEFSSIETLDVRHSGLANMRQVGRANCRKGHEDLGQCPYQLKYLSFGNLKIEHLFNNSFCQFRKLEFLGILDCGLRTIEADAFVHLVHLKEVSLQRNRLTHLPSNLFSHHVQLQTVDMMDNRLQSSALTAFLALSSLRNLYLSRNNISLAINARWRFPSKLELIAMDNNELNGIRLEFANLKHLQYLVVSNGGVNYVDENAFQRAPELRVIDLENNNVEKLSQNTFKNNLELRELWLANNRLMDFPPIAHLRKLREIEVDRNGIGTINNGHLVNCTRLTFANFSHNQLSFIEAKAFDNIVQLRQLSLRHNRLTQLTVDFSRANILEMFLDFNNFTACSYGLFPKNLIHLSLSHNRIRTIEAFDFTDQIEWSLAVLILSNNRITSVEHLQLPPSIEEIDLSHNLITDVLSMDEIAKQKLTKLWSIDLRGNRILTLCQSLFVLVGKSVIGETGYYISGNPLECNCENMWLKHWRNSTLFTFEDLDNVHCRDTRPYISHPNALVALTQLPDEDFLCQSDHENSNRCNCPINDHEHCQLPCPTNCTCLSNYFKTNIYFACNSRHFQTIPKDLKYNAQYASSISNALDLSGNSISHLSVIDFRKFSTTFVLLNLSNSSVKSVHQNAFDNLINLKKLNLAHNEIEALPDGVFRKLRKLTHLDLSNNRLKTLADDAFSSQTLLRNLYLHNNSLRHVELSQIRRLSNVTLNDNPWSCHCKFILALQPFLVNTSTTLNRKLELNCTENGQEINISTFDVEPCLTQTDVSILIISVTIGVVIIIAIALVYRWRFVLQVIIYARYGFRLFHEPEEDVASKEYDAFVAYNSEDTDFLIRQLMPGLEAIANPYHLCIHERDFPDDLYIQDSLLDAISMSSRTIILLSENFVKSGWCGHMRMLEDRCPRILVVVVGEVPEALEPEMKLYLTANTCLRWGERWFWQKLYYAMPDQRVSSPPAHCMPMRNL